MSRGNGRVYRPSYRDRHGILRESKIWWIEFSSEAHVTRESTKVTVHKKAVAYLRRRQAEVARTPDPGAVMFANLEAMILADYRVNSRTSIKRLTGSLKHLKIVFGERRAIDITSGEINAYSARRTADGAAPATITHELASLSRMFTLALRENKILTKPYIAKIAVNNARTGFFERDQLDALLEHLPEELRPVVEVAYYTGWRMHSEILSRRPQHLDLINGWLRLDPGETKNKEGRNFPLTGRLREVIASQAAKNAALEAASGTRVGWLFNREGEPIRDYRRAWKTACARAGISGRIPHDFRRTAVRNLEMAGVHRSAAQKLVGHKSEAIYRRYAIVDQAMLTEAAKKLDHFHEENLNQSARHNKDGVQTI